MTNIHIEPGTKTPAIIMTTDGRIELSGKSIPENSAEFFKPVFDWLNEYAAKPANKTKVKIKLEYFNTSSSKCILDIFRKLEIIHKSGSSSVEISWLYDADDEDMMETGEDYQTLVKIPFRIEQND